MRSDLVGRDDRIKPFIDEDSNIGVPISGAGGDRKEEKGFEDRPKAWKGESVHNERK
jgi:hypothetical protein